jgi:alkylation response protein AidB-like acyl-CoA dehydrogenase
MTSASTAGVAVDLPSRARAVGLIADQYADVAETSGKLADPVVDALHREGILGMWVPRSVNGGAELDPLAALQVIENLAYGDPSAGWVAMAASLAIGTGAAYLEQSAVDELFRGSRLPVIAGQGTRPGTAVRSGDGFLLSGSWSFASGIKHATHIHTLAVIEDTGEPRIFVLPVGVATLIDNCDVIGLRGTGSIDYRIDKAFVPEAYTHFAITESSKRGGSVYKLGIIGFACIAHSGWASGLGRRMLDELVTRVHGGIGRTGSLAESDSFQERYGRIEAAYRAARALVVETWAGVQETLARGDAVTPDQHTLMRLAMAHITWTCHDVAEFAYTAAGTLALRAGTLQRLFRDMHAGTQHVVASPPVFRRTGQMLAGLAPKKRWLFLDLIDQS